MFKKIIILTAMLVAALTISASAAEFTDVPETHWAHDSIVAMSEKGIINGVGNGRFSPDAPVTVEQFATMLVRQFGAGNLNTTGSTWYVPYMEAAEADGYLANVTTEVCEPLNRFNMAHMIYNVLPVLPYGSQDTFNDTTLWKETISKIGDWGTLPVYVDEVGDAMSYVATDLQRAVYACYKSGLLTGVNAAGEFKGEGTMTRSQAAVVMERLINYTDSFSAEAHPIPVNAQRPTKVSTGGNGTYSNGVCRLSAGQVSAGMGIGNITADKVTFSITPASGDLLVSTYAGGTTYLGIVRKGHTATFTVDLNGASGVSLDAGSSYAEYTLSNIWLHD